MRGQIGAHVPHFNMVGNGIKTTLAAAAAVVLVAAAYLRFHSKRARRMHRTLPQAAQGLIRAHALTGGGGCGTFTGYVFSNKDAERLVELVFELSSKGPGHVLRRPGPGHTLEGSGMASGEGGERLKTARAEKIGRDFIRLLRGEGKILRREGVGRCGYVEVTYGPLPRPGTHIVIGGGPTVEQLEAAGPSLEAVLIPFAGLPPQLRKTLQENSDKFKAVSVYSIHHNAAYTAEMAVALCLCAAKNLLPADRLLRKGDWSARGIPAAAGCAPRPMPMLLLSGKTALVLGYGQVGRRVAIAMLALGMRVLATRSSQAEARTTPEGVIVYPARSFHSLLPRAHVVFVCLPSTPDTDNLISSVELDLLPTDAVLVNVGRGAVIDEQALHRALSPGWLVQKYKD